MQCVGSEFCRVNKMKGGAQRHDGEQRGLECECTVKHYTVKPDL